MTATIRPLDANTRTVDGRYEDDLVVVSRGRGLPDAFVATADFDLARCGDRLQLGHCLGSDDIHDDLAGLLSEQLFRPGWVTGGEHFERLVTGIVLSSADDPQSAWDLFYRNTLRRLDDLRANATAGQHGSLAGYGPVFARAMKLTGSGSALELGCCFGFLSLQLARQCRRVVATDISAGTVALLARTAPRLGVSLGTMTCDAAHVPLPPGAVDTVLAVHLFEHLEPVHAFAVLVEAMRLARRRVIVAVPYEHEPDAAFGHLRTLDAAELHVLGATSGWAYEVQEHHGGWLILDHPSVCG